MTDEPEVVEPADVKDSRAVLAGFGFDFDASQAARIVRAYEAGLAAAPRAGDPVAWLHTLHMEGDQTFERVTLDDGNAFGDPGRDYSAEYDVTSEPLFLAAPPAVPDSHAELVAAAYAYREASADGYEPRALELSPVNPDFRSRASALLRAAERLPDRDGGAE